MNLAEHVSIQSFSSHLNEDYFLRRIVSDPLGGRNASLIRSYAPRFSSSGCRSTASTVMSPLPRTIGPEHPPSCRCLILEIGLENFDPVLAAQIFDFVRRQAVVSGIRGKITKSFDPLLEKLFLCLAEFSCLLTRRKIVPERLHVRHSHTDPEGHEMDLSFDECG